MSRNRQQRIELYFINTEIAQNIKIALSYNNFINHLKYFYTLSQTTEMATQAEISLVINIL